MKKLLNTLYVTTQGAYLACDNETVAVRIEGETKLRVPIHTLSSVVCFGQVSCSPPLMGLCGSSGVALSFMTERGRFLARVEGPRSGNVLLRREQYRRADSEPHCVAIAKAAVSAKLANCRTVLLRAAREASVTIAQGEQPLRHAAQQLARVIQKLQEVETLDSLRGLEGEAGQIYFSVFDNLIADDQPSFRFRGRNRRPPLDNTNALLSFHYTLLAHDVAAALDAVGLDPGVGFLHRDRPGRAGLALDVMEELRPMLGDRLVLNLINRKQLSAKDFHKSETGAVEMTDDARKTVLVNYQKRKQDEIQHPFLDETIPLGMLPFAQALLLARYLRGDLDGYPAFIWK